MFADLGLLLFGITMAIGAAKRVLFLCDATLSTYLGTIGCPLAKPKNSNNEMCFDFSRSLQLWKHETPTMLTEKCCRGSGWIRGMFHAAIRKLRCGLEDFGWAASRV